jgi:microcystin-dependent protein
MTEPFIGQIIQGGWNFAPRGYAYCNGQQMSIAQNTALFSLLGTTYGGNGTTTFGLPDLRGRSMINQGQSPGLSNYVLGQMGGTENVTVTSANLPAHTHPFTGTGTVGAATGKATEATPANGMVLARSVDAAPNPVSNPEIYLPAGTPTTVTLAGVNVSGTTGVAGTGVPVATLSPFTCVSVVIALQGIFPSRN